VQANPHLHQFITIAASLLYNSTTNSIYHPSICYGHQTIIESSQSSQTHFTQPAPLLFNPNSQFIFNLQEAPPLHQSWQQLSSIINPLPSSQPVPFLFTVTVETMVSIVSFSFFFEQMRCRSLHPDRSIITTGASCNFALSSPAPHHRAITAPSPRRAQPSPPLFLCPGRT
jgi:hypothetical protein